MHRRAWLLQSAACLAALAYDGWDAFSMNIPSPRTVRKALNAFDHVLLGTPSLDEGIGWMEQKTGVRAKLGGSHPGRGTRNALLSLGPLQYLEIIAPDPEQPNVQDGYGLRQLSSPRLVQWAIHTDDIAAVKRLATSAGIQTVGPEPGSRQTPDGGMLRWQTLGIAQTTPLVPFFIEWDRGAAHPSSAAPKVGSPKSLHFQTPQPGELDRILRSVDIEAEITTSDSPRIVLGLETARGWIEIG